MHATEALLGGKDPVTAEDVGGNVGQGEVVRYGEGVGQNMEEDEQESPQLFPHSCRSEDRVRCHMCVAVMSEGEGRRSASNKTTKYSVAGVACALPIQR